MDTHRKSHFDLTFPFPETGMCFTVMCLYVSRSSDVTVSVVIEFKESAGSGLVDPDYSLETLTQPQPKRFPVLAFWLLKYLLLTDLARGLL
jgi:hypothetical protein